MGKAKLKTKDYALDLKNQQNSIRTLICFAASGTVAAHLKWPNVSSMEAAMLLGIILYTAITYLALHKSHKEQQAKRFSLITTADAAIVGFVLSFVQFTLMPTFLFITMIQFNSLIHGGTSKWIKDNLAFAAGVAFTFLIWQPQWRLSGHFTINVASLIGIFTYFCAYALYLHNRLQKLQLSNKKLANEQRLYKLRTYKLSRYLTPTVWNAVNEGREESLKTERKRVTVFFSDIEGFSSLSEELEAETVSDLLNAYLTEMTKIATKNKGTIDKFMGDGLMIIFGDSQTQGLKQDCLRCLSMAIEMRRKMKELQTRWYNQGIKKPLRIRMGINTGFCTVGSFGTSDYCDYTVLGTHVNLASRLESAADSGEILISYETWSLIKDTVLCRDKGEINVKGFSHPVKVYQVVDFRKDLGRHQSYYEEMAEGFSMHMDLDKIRNYDKERVVESLEKIVERLKDKIIN